LFSSNETVEGFSFPVHLGFGSGGLFEKLRRTIEKNIQIQWLTHPTKRTEFAGVIDFKQ